MDLPFVQRYRWITALDPDCVKTRAAFGKIDSSSAADPEHEAIHRRCGQNPDYLAGQTLTYRSTVMEADLQIRDESAGAGLQPEASDANSGNWRNDQGDGGLKGHSLSAAATW
jgi:hypothetical protein